MTAGDRLSSTTLLALLPDRPSVPLSSLPEWTWGLTQQYKTNNTSARPSVFPATRQLTFQLTVVHVVTDSASPQFPLSFPDRPHRTAVSLARMCEAICVSNISTCWVKAMHVACFWFTCTQVPRLLFHAVTLSFLPVALVQCSFSATYLLWQN